MDALANATNPFGGFRIFSPSTLIERTPCLRRAQSRPAVLLVASGMLIRQWLRASQILREPQHVARSAITSCTFRWTITSVLVAKTNGTTRTGVINQMCEKCINGGLLRLKHSHDLMVKLETVKGNVTLTGPGRIHCHTNPDPLTGAEEVWLIIAADNLKDAGGPSVMKSADIFGLLALNEAKRFHTMLGDAIQQVQRSAETLGR